MKAEEISKIWDNNGKVIGLIKDDNLDKLHETHQNLFEKAMDSDIPKKEIEAEDIPLDIIYEDDDIIVLNKQPNIIVHPARGNTHGTLVNALLAHCRDLSGIGGVVRPGIVHRLDKDTSGLLIVAKHDGAHVKLSSDLSERNLRPVRRRDEDRPQRLDVAS